jgi:hypothetical protein
VSHGFKSRGECGPEELEAAQAFAPEATRALFAGIGNGERLIALSGALRAQSGGGVVADAIDGWAMGIAGYAEPTQGSDELLDIDQAAAAIEAEPGAPMGVAYLLGMAAHGLIEGKFGATGPGAPKWLDRTTGTIAKDMGAEQAPVVGNIRPDCAGAVGSTVHIGEIKPWRQGTGVAAAQAGKYVTDLGTAGIPGSLMDTSGGWANTPIKGNLSTFNMDVHPEGGQAPGAVIYAFKRAAPDKIPETVPVPDLKKVGSKINELLYEIERLIIGDPWVLVPVAFACLAVALMVALFLMAKPPFLLPI